MGGVHVGGSNNLTRRRRRRRERIILVIGNGWVMGLYLKEEGGAGNWVIREIATHRRVVVGRRKKNHCEEPLRCRGMCELYRGGARGGRGGGTEAFLAVNIDVKKINNNNSLTFPDCQRRLCSHDDTSESPLCVELRESRPSKVKRFCGYRALFFSA